MTSPTNSIPAAAQTATKWAAAPLLFPLGFASAEAIQNPGNTQQLLIWLGVYLVTSGVYVLSSWLQGKKFP